MVQGEPSAMFRGPDQRGSVAMSALITRSLRKAVVQQAPIEGAIGNGVMSCL